MNYRTQSNTSALVSICTREGWMKWKLKTKASSNNSLSLTTCNLSTTQQELHDLQQYTRRNNLEIHGIPEQPDEDTDSIVTKVANTVGVRITSSDIDISHRLPSRSHQEHITPAPIIVRFTRRTICNNIYAARKRLKNKSTKDINIGNHSDNRIYINENLSPANKQLFHKTNEKKKYNLKWKFIWTNNGRIFVKRNEEGRALKIITLHDIERMQ
ncbi:uncharacterized protein LOC144452789 [Glandiceps talaboti]